MANQAPVTVSAPPTATYQQAGLSVVASGGSGTGAYSYSQGASTACTVNGTTGALTITSGTGTCAITATRAGDANYNPSAASAPASVTINRAMPVVTVTGGVFMYDGNAHAGSATAILNDVNVTGTFSFTYNGVSGQPTNAGTYNVVASFTSADATNYAKRREPVRSPSPRPTPRSVSMATRACMTRPRTARPGRRRASAEAR